MKYFTPYPLSIVERGWREPKKPFL